MNRTATLDRAKYAVADRPNQYGAPENNFERIARLWNAHIKNGSGQNAYLAKTDVAIMLGLVKVARLEQDVAHLDSWVDLAGYAACGAEVSGAGEVFDSKPVCDLVDDVMRHEAKQTPRTDANCVAKHGFKIGDHVNYKDAPFNSEHGEVVGFNGDRVVVDFPNSTHNYALPRSLQLTSWAGVKKPESKYGFTVGETVNLTDSNVGARPGKVVSFRKDKAEIGVQWPHWPGDRQHFVPAKNLRHGP